MKLLGQTWYVARAELQFFRRFPKLLWATMAVILIPSLYAIIYLASVWDPASNTKALSVALVNLDEGVEYREHVFNVGWQVVAKLKSGGQFGYKDYADPVEVRQLVREGKLAFALIIPPDFSSHAIPGAQPGGGKLVVYAAEGNNFEVTALARQFARELGHEVNESLNERRWSLVLSNAAGSQRSVERLHQSVEQIRAGAKELSSGTAQASTGARTLAIGADHLHDGVDQLTSGVKQLGAGLRTMDSKRPGNGELNRLKAGADALAAGHIELTEGYESLKTGAAAVDAGMQNFKAEANDSILISAKVKEGVSQLADGTSQLEAGIKSAGDAQLKLSEGAGKVATGVGALTGGVRQLTGAVRTMVTKLPEDSTLDELNTGAAKVSLASTALAEGMQRLKTGSQSLATGLDLLESSLPKQIDAPEGSAEGLANSVQPMMEVDATVQNNGSGFAANVIPAALWLGAGIAAFLIHVRVLPRQAQRFSAPARLLGKVYIPLVVVLLQAALLTFTVVWGMHIQILHFWAFAAVLAITSATFLMIVFALTRAFGDAGKALAMIFLAVQLSSSGGVLPVELSGGIFAQLSPWMPLTWVVRALKASMFGAFDGAWQTPTLWVCAAFAVSVVAATYIGSWRFVKTGSVRPAVDF